MVTLDFTDCKSPEDVKKVFQENDSELRNAKSIMNKVQITPK